MKNLISRVESLEAKIKPPLDLLIVLVEKNEMCEEAKARVLKEHDLDKVPNGCTVVTLNIHGNQLK